jgi:hypothetical protein
VAALHVDRDHPHVHLTIARRDHDGRRFHPNRDDFFVTGSASRKSFVTVALRRMPRQLGQGGLTPSMSPSRRSRFARRARFPALTRAAPSGPAATRKRCWRSCRCRAGVPAGHCSSGL